MDATSPCLNCGAAASREVQFGLCPACLLESFLTTTGVFAPENLTPEAEQMRHNFHVGQGRFQLMERIGLGGMGEVWLAEDIVLDRKQTVLKFVKQAWRHDARLINELRQEFIRTSDLNEPHTVKFHHWHTSQDEPPFISMEYVPGPSLSVLLENHADGLPYLRLHPLLLDVCQALAHAHKQGILHRDIKPANILTCSSGGVEQAKLADFGIGRFVDDRQATGGGTKAYMSSAQANCEQPALSDDIFALGVTMYQLLSGKLPYGREGCLEGELLPLVEAFANESRCNSVPKRVRALVLSCLALQPINRPETVVKVMELLQQNPPLEHFARPSPPRRATFQPIEQVPTRRFPPGLGLPLLLLFALGLVYWQRAAVYDYFSPARPEPEPPPLRREPPPLVKTEWSALAITVANANSNLLLSLASSKTNLKGSAPDGFTLFPRLPPGPYRLRAEQRGYATTNLGLELQPGRTNRADLILAHLSGQLQFKVPTDWPDYSPGYQWWSADEPSLVWSNKVTSGTVTLSNLPAGEWYLRLIWPGESTITKRVAIEPHTPRTVPFTFERVGVNVTNLSAENLRLINAEVSWHDKSGAHTIGTPTRTTLYLKEGERTISFKAEGFYEQSTNITLVANRSKKPIDITVVLTRSLHPLPNDRFTNALGMAFIPLGKRPPGFRNVWMGRTEVTRGQFERFVRSTTGLPGQGMYCLTPNGRKFYPDRGFRNPGFDAPDPDQHPVVGVSWQDAMNFCRWLTQTERAASQLRSNESYSLPTGDQWEFACQQRGPPQRGNWAGLELAQDPNWPTDWKALLGSAPDSFPRTAPVGVTEEVDPSSVGSRLDLRNLFDNVQEWCLDDYSGLANTNEVLQAYYNALTRQSSSPSSIKVVCGGSWYDHDPLLWQPTSRHCAPRDERTDYRGFRVVIVEHPPGNPP